MADDLTQFLAKKAAKSREKKKKLKVEDVGNVLDRKAKKQVSYNLSDFYIVYSSLQ